MVEPQGIQLQDLIDKPFQARSVSRKSEFEQNFEALAYWQMRILDLQKCISGTHLDCRPVRFNLQLSDPVEAYLDSDSKWPGISGSYVVTLGRESEVEQGSDKDLPTLRASVNAFTRMWLGVSPASSLMVTDDLFAPGDLPDQLDMALRLPRPAPGWEF